MKRGLILISVLFLVFIISCAPSQECPTCEEKECPEVKCPTDTKETTKYVCSDDRVVDTKEGCTKETSTEDKLYAPITTNEEESYITSVTTKPGCYRGLNSAIITYDIGVLADKVRYQVKEDPSEEFKTLYEMNGVSKATRYAVICDCYSGDFQLKPGKQYLFRVEFDLTSLFSTTQYSNEHIIDTRETSDYMTKFCAD